MSTVPRFAVGTFQPGADSQIVLWAFLDSLHRSGLEVQSFHSRACFPRYPGSASITGRIARHLDSWLMSPDLCREIFLRGVQTADLAVVEGRFSPVDDSSLSGGALEPLCQWLDLPRVAVLDVSRAGHCRLPNRPPSLDAILLDRVADSRQAAQFATEFESLWGIPVLGALELLPQLRARFDAIPRGNRLPADLCQVLGDHFMRHWKPERLLEIARRREFPAGRSRGMPALSALPKLTVAIAYDEAFNCYYPDLLDLLELQGASVVDFSPLRDENLPPQVDIVYFGCGHPERFAAALSENHCMASALRSHLCAGRRIYGEGGGAAYLCHQMETPAGDLKRMAGVLPAVARFERNPSPVRPMEITLARSNWLGEQGARLRGYRSSFWRFEPAGDLVGFAAEREHDFDMIGNFHAVGSLLHLHFAAQPKCLDRFFVPGVPQSDLFSPPSLPALHDTLGW
jgi:cobyrinic acid a,c-diamide synthase